MTEDPTPRRTLLRRAGLAGGAAVAAAASTMGASSGAAAAPRSTDAAVARLVRRRKSRTHRALKKMTRRALEDFRTTKLPADFAAQAGDASTPVGAAINNLILSRGILFTQPGQDIQAALNAAAAAGGGAVTLSAGTFQLSAGLVLGTGVSLIGMGRQATRLVLADGGGQPVIRNADRVAGNERITLRGFSVNGNRGRQPVANSAIDLVRCGELDVRDVIASNAGVHGLRISGEGQLTRQVLLDGVYGLDNEGRGVDVSYTMRDVHYLHVVAERNGSDGVRIDHSEAKTTLVIARQNGGAGIWVHNVVACALDGLTSKFNNGVGILIDGVVASTGSGWLAMANCQLPGTGPKAEVLVTANAYSYGVTRAAAFYNLIVCGDAQRLGGIKADYGVFVQDGVVDLRIVGVEAGDGARRGDVRAPADVRVTRF